MNSTINNKVKAILVFMLMYAGLVVAQGIEPADIERVGQSGWQFLKINGDARVSAMGGAYVAAGSGDATSAFWKPCIYGRCSEY